MDVWDCIETFHRTKDKKVRKRMYETVMEISQRFDESLKSRVPPCCFRTVYDPETNSWLVGCRELLPEEKFFEVCRDCISKAKAFLEKYKDELY